MIYGGFVFATFYCCRNQKDHVQIKKDSKYSPRENSWSYLLILLPILLTTLALIAFGFAVGADAKVYGETREVVEIVMEAADKAVETLNKTAEAMEEIRDLLTKAKNNNVIDDQSAEEVEFLASTTHQLHFASANIGNQTKQHRHFMCNFLKIVYVKVIITVSIEVLIAVAVSATAILRLWHALLRFSRDTCAALEDFEVNPENNSLSSILHCNAQQAKLLLSMNERIYNLVKQVNAEMEVKWNPTLGSVCNPFSGPPHFLYIQQQNCPHSIPLTNLPQVISGLACSGNGGKEGEACKYKEIEVYRRTIQKVVDLYPSVEDLLQCGSVKDAFLEIIRNHCKPITRFLRMVWVAVLCFSILVLLSLFWPMPMAVEQSYTPKIIN